MAQRILIVDDEPDIRHGVDLWLKSAGFETMMAGDGDEGLQEAISQQPDGILLDMRMPKKDGMQTLTELKSNERTNEIPVVMLSASLRDEQRVLDAGAKFFVRKPYNGRMLVATIRAAMGQPSAPV